MHGWTRGVRGLGKRAQRIALPFTSMVHTGYRYIFTVLLLLSTSSTTYEFECAICVYESTTRAFTRTAVVVVVMY